MANPISMAILNLLAGAGGGYNQAAKAGREEQLGLVERQSALQEAQKGREFATSERKASQEYGTSERVAGQQYGTSERVGRQGFEAGQAQLGREFQHQERIGGEQFQSGENKLNRSNQMGIAGLEARTAINTARIHEGLDTTDPLIQARQAGIKAYLMALEHPETLMRGETAELKMLQAYNITKQMLQEQGVFAPVATSPLDQYSSPLGPRLNTNPFTMTEAEFTPFLQQLLKSGTNKGYKGENYFPQTRTEP